MGIQEGLGYTLRDYDPCFNFNQDLFCCSKPGAELRQNLNSCNNAVPRVHGNHNVLRNHMPEYDASMAGSAASQLFQPSSYVFTPQADWNISCGRMNTCNINATGPQCQHNQPSCKYNGACGGN